MPHTSPLASSTTDQVTTLTRGGVASLTTRSGTISSASLQGLFHRDERLLSHLELLVDGVAPRLLDAARTSPYDEVITYATALDEYRNATAVLVRRRQVRLDAYEEHLELRSFGSSIEVAVAIDLEADFASVLALKSAVPPPPPGIVVLGAGPSGAVARIVPTKAADPSLRVAGVRRAVAPAAEIAASPGAVVEASDHRVRLSWNAVATPAQPFRCSFSVALDAIDPGAGPADLVVTGDRRWSDAIAASCADVRALRMSVDTPTGQPLTFVAAGSPWYLAIFGRDSLLTSRMMLPTGTDMAMETLETLAALQGRSVNPLRQEEPGRIVHEVRVGTTGVFEVAAFEPYYASVDAPALFCGLLAEAYRWGADPRSVKALLPAAREALAWCLHTGERLDQKYGFLRYESDEQGLGNQGWKDSGDCIVHADGRHAEGPIALCEVQGYLHEALVSMARLERDLGDPEHEASLLTRADDLTRAFTAAFVADDGLVALALDGDHEPLWSQSSNPGHCLWSGLFPTEVARRVADRLAGGTTMCAWGVRTLGTDNPKYNPFGYHLGTVWPHDSAIVAAGLFRAGADEAGRRVLDGTLRTAEHFRWRLPELLSGLDDGLTTPLPYPASCSPQAWGAAAPVLLLRSVLGLDVDVPAGVVRLAPRLAADESLRITGIVVGDHTASVHVKGREVVDADFGLLRVEVG